MNVFDGEVSLNRRKKILNIIDGKIKKPDYSLQTFVYMTAKNDYGTTFDGVIKTFDDEQVAVINIVDKLNDKDNKIYNYLREPIFIRDFKSITNARFAIITDGTTYHYYDRFDSKINVDNPFTKNNLSIEELIKEIFVPVKEDRIITIINNMKELYSDYDIDGIVELFDSLSIDNIRYDDTSISFTDEFEEKLFSLFISKTSDIKVVCRYVNLESIYWLLKTNKMRLYGLAAMNDRTEVDYVDSFIFQDRNQDYQNKPFPIIENINHSFISSCSEIEIEDNLTQYRLYADDGKGVCLEFEVRSSSLPKGFYLANVIYNTEVLSMIRDITNLVYDVTGLFMKFNKLSVYKHFFKPDDYEIEKEIRLLYSWDETKTPEIQWIMASGSNIFNPYVEFDITKDSFPLKLTKIILGPKCPEEKINLRQIEMMRKENSKFSNVVVELTHIKNYR